jgi:hypothetical protein
LDTVGANDKAATARLQKYLDIVSAYETEFKKWDARAKKIIKRYRDDTRGQTNNETAKFNVLWANVQIRLPAVFAKLPKADVSRRFRDNDQVGRVASLLLERSLDFEVEHYPDFRTTMTACVLDRLLPGRGVAWARYEPHVSAQDEPDDGLQITEDARDTGEMPGDAAPVGDGPLERLEYECAPVDYVHWADFGHSVARTWEEVTQVWRWVYLTKEAATERFGKEAADKLAFNSTPDPLQKKTEKRERNLAKVCELWDKEAAEAVWFAKDGMDLIDIRPDPLELEQFFPCPPPLFATMTSDTLIPVPDFALYQDQANDLDILADRIDGLIKALRVRGVYDASVPELQRLLTEGDNNTLIPVAKWMGLSEKGGLKGAIDLLPLDVIAAALLDAYKAFDQVKGQIDELTGISDIIRGETEASETATAQQIKGQYAGLRLRTARDEVALFATQLLRLKAHIICTKFQPETILQYASAEQLSEADRQLVPQALELLKSDPLRSFRIQVASDSLVQIDEAQEKDDRLAFIEAAGAYIQNAILPTAQVAPDLLPMSIELFKFGIGAFKEARSIEGTLDAMLEQLRQKQAQAQAQAQANPQPPPPDPAMMKAEAEVENIKTRTQLDVARTQAELQADQQRLAMEGVKHEAAMVQGAQRAQMQAQRMMAGPPRA